jgi:hypothetical protein
MCDQEKEKSEIKYRLFIETLQSYNEEYSRQLDKWRDFERKAQVNITLAAALLAAIFTFVRLELSRNALIFNILCIVIIFALSISIYRSLKVLKIRIMNAPIPSSHIQKIVDENLKLDDIAELRSLQLGSISAKFYSLRETIVSINDENEKKADYLYQSHFFLVSALFLVAIYSILILVPHI